MLGKLKQIWLARDLRNNLLFVTGLLVIFRVLAHIPIPGINQENLKDLFSQNQLLGLLNIFSGGGIETFSIVALGVAPYITASIIFQLLVMVIPQLEELSKEGDYGRQKINQYTRWLSAPLAILQGVGLVTLLTRSASAGRPILPASIDTLTYVTIIMTLAAGTILLMWIGEIISERKVGNGISLIIFTGILASVPGIIQNTWQLIINPVGGIDQQQIINLLVFAAIAVVTVLAVVFITEAQRNLPVSYAKRIRGNRVYGGVDTYLPLRVNQAGVIPIIFAISILLFPPLIAQFFASAKTTWLANLAASVTRTFVPTSKGYLIIYFFLVVIFTFFYTAVIFQPTQIAENLQKQGGFVPGIRPGRPTAEYLGYVINRIILAGAVFLGAIAILPMIMEQATGLASLAIGGTSVLIVVSVVIETIQQIKAQLVMRDYESFI
jgi:preprotein translocase subunit SecY